MSEKKHQTDIYIIIVNGPRHKINTQRNITKMHYIFWRLESLVDFNRNDIFRNFNHTFMIKVNFKAKYNPECTAIKF